LASKFFENQHKSLSFSDLYFIFGKDEISCRDVLDIDEDKNFILGDENLIPQDENLVLQDENLIPGDGNFILDVTGDVFTLISNAANVFKNTLIVFQKNFVQVGNCSFLNSEGFKEI